MDEKELQEKLIVYQLLQRHLESLTQSAVLIERRYEEMEASGQALKDIEKSGQSEILIPLGSGLFTHGKSGDSRKLIVDAGAGIFLEKDMESAKELLEQKRQDIEKLAGSMQQEMIEVSSRLNSLAMEIESCSREAGKETPEHGKNSGKAGRISG
jgi:prefoldin alpha subunit